MSIAEMIGVLFKTHKDNSMNLLQMIYSIVPQALSIDYKQKNLFGIYILDDIVEQLGP